MRRIGKSAFLVGWVMERRFIKFSTDISMKKRAARMGVGLLSYYAVNLIICPFLKSAVTGAAGTMLSCFLQMFYIVFLYPMIFEKILETHVPED